MLNEMIEKQKILAENDDSYNLSAQSKLRVLLEVREFDREGVIWAFHPSGILLSDNFVVAIKSHKWRHQLKRVWYRYSTPSSLVEDLRFQLEFRLDQ